MRNAEGTSQRLLCATATRRVTKKRISQNVTKTTTDHGELSMVLSFASKARSPRPPKLLLHRHASLHAPDVLLVQVLIEAGVEVRPPLKQHRLANKLEPGRELEARVFEELLKLIGRNVLGVANLVEVGVKIDIGLDEKDVIDCIR